MRPLHLQKPHLIVVVGIPGSGKTHFARQFSAAYSMPFLHLAELHEKLKDEDLASKMAEYVLGQLLKTRSSILIEGTGALRAERQSIGMIAEKYGYSVLFVWAQTELATAKKRALRDTRMTDELFIQAARKFSPLNMSENFTVISGKHAFTSQVQGVLKKLATEPQMSLPKATPQPQSTSTPVSVRMKRPTGRKTNRKIIN